VKLGTENKMQTIIVAVLGALLLLVVVYQFWPSSSTIASTVTPTPDALSLPAAPASHKGSATPAKKPRAEQSLDPTLHLDQLAAVEQIKYEGTGRNIFVAEADPVIPKPLAPGHTDAGTAARAPYQIPPQTPAPPIPLKFFGFASQPGEAKKIFLSKGDDVFIAGEGEIVDRRYKVLRITTTSVEIQDVVNSGPPQNIPLMQTNPS
jgi:hypothetical protein